MWGGLRGHAVEQYFAALDSVACLRVCRVWNREMDSETVWAQRLRKQVQRDCESDQCLFFSLAWLKHIALEKGSLSTLTRGDISVELRIREAGFGPGMWYTVRLTYDRDSSRSHSTALLKSPRLDLEFIKTFKRDFGLYDEFAVSTDTVEQCEQLGAVANRLTLTPAEPTSKLVLKGNLARTRTRTVRAKESGGTRPVLALVILVLALCLQAFLSRGP